MGPAIAAGIRRMRSTVHQQSNVSPSCLFAYPMSACMQGSVMPFPHALASYVCVCRSHAGGTDDRGARSTYIVFQDIARGERLVYRRVLVELEVGQGVF